MYQKQKKCAICGNLFYYKHVNHQCCSRECGTKLRDNNLGYIKHQVNCGVCGASFNIKNYKYTDAKTHYCSRKCYGIIRKEWMKTEEHNPTLNKGHSTITRRLISKITASRVVAGNMLNGSCKSGKRTDLGGIFFRSSWEANYARILNYLHIEWKYEPKAFHFDGYKNGAQNYIPDFYLPKEDCWVEVKGWFRSEARTKIKRFAKQYPSEFSKLKFVLSYPQGKNLKFLKKLNPDMVVEGYYNLMKEYKDKIIGWE